METGILILPDYRIWICHFHPEDFAIEDTGVASFAGITHNLNTKYTANCIIGKEYKKNVLFPIPMQGGVIVTISRKGEKIYEDCRKQTADFIKLVGSESNLEKLREVLYEMDNQSVSVKTKPKM